MIGALRSSPSRWLLALAPAARGGGRGVAVARARLVRRRRSARCEPWSSRLERKVELMELSAARYADWRRASAGSR